MESDGIGDAVRQIVELVGQTKQTTILSAPEKTGSYYLVGPNGNAELKVAGPAWHKETLDTPKELRRFIEDRAIPDGAVFLGEDKVVYVYSLADRRDVAVCPLTLSPQYTWLKSQSEKMLTQADLVRLLRITFRGCMTSENLLPIVRQVKFDSGDSGQTDIQHGRQSMGRNITAQVLGADVIPEETALSVPVFENHNFKARITCAIEVFPAERVFKLTPYPLEVKAAMDEVMADLEELFGETGSNLPPVYRGKP